MTIFTVPGSGAGSPGPAGPPGAAAATSYGSILSVFLFSFTSQAFTANAEQKINGWGTNGISAGVTPDQAGERLVFNTTGVYEIYFGYTYKGSVNWTFNFLEVRLDGVLVPQLSLTDYEGSTNRASCASIGTVGIAAGSVLEVYAETSVNVTVDWLDGALSAWRVS